MTQAFVPLPRKDLLISEIETELCVNGLGAAAEGVPRELWERCLLGPAREFFGRGGKGFRAELVTSAWEIAGGRGDLPIEAAMLVELLHGGSLIIDDIQDGSEQRRGAPALHLLIGAPLAINTGNWLYFYAEALASRLGLAPSAELALRRAVNSAVLRCHYGQALDLSAQVGVLAHSQVLKVVRATTLLKTGSLFELAARIGAITAGATDAVTERLAAFGRGLGIGLQMLDDLSGVCSARHRHKGEEDLIHGRPTWVWAWLAEQLDELGYSRLQHTMREVERRVLAPEVVMAVLRERVAAPGRAKVQSHLARTLADLYAVMGPSPALRSLEVQVARIEESYA